MAREAPANPHQDVQFYTSWDGMFGRPKPKDALSEEAKLERTLSGLSSNAHVDITGSPQ